MVFALVGNQNCGKTTLFNQLTGSNQHVGNFPGVTVEQKSGGIRGYDNTSVVDLPGIYSLSPYTDEEIVTRDFIIRQRPDGIINIIDSTNIERNLYLTLQLIELSVPMVVALNMIDEFYGNGGSINLERFVGELGVPVVPVSAAKNEGVDELVKLAVETAGRKALPKRVDFCAGPVHRCLHGICHLIEDHAAGAGIAPRFAAAKLIEGDKPMEAALNLSPNELETVEHCIVEMESDLGTDREAALADMRYAFIETLTAHTVTKPRESREAIRSGRIDRLLTHKYLGIPIYFAIMLLIFWLTFGLIGRFLSWLTMLAVGWAAQAVSGAMIAAGINPVARAMVVNGAISGVGAVLSFLPIIVTLFFFLSLLEDSGYIARVSFIMDKMLRRIGLSGKSLAPMIMGFGCSVPAIMATRTLSSERDKKMTILLIPFLSCSAKLAVFGMLSAAFFPGYAALVMIALYAGGVLIGILVGFIMKWTVFRGKSMPFVLELPNYRMPSLKSVGLLVWERARDFLQRAFTVIFAVSMIIWFLQSFDMRINVAANSEDSILAHLGTALAGLLAPLGFGDWRAATALISGFTAKEVVLSSLAVLMNASAGNLSAALHGLFTPLAAASFLMFTLLYTPCVAAIATVRRELNTAWAVYIAFFQIAIAWVFAFLVYQIGSLFIK